MDIKKQNRRNSGIYKYQEICPPEFKLLRNRVFISLSPYQTHNQNYGCCSLHYFKNRNPKMNAISLVLKYKSQYIYE